MRRHLAMFTAQSDRPTVFITCVLMLLVSSYTASAADKEWRFRVFLDDTEIGFHTFQVSHGANDRILRTQARFDVRILFFSAYTYEHTNTETWKDNCLKRIDAQTNDNGTLHAVQGDLGRDFFEVRAARGATKLPPCVMTFAYWNPHFLQARRLLNAQTGDYLDVIVQHPTEERITVRGKGVTAYRYRVTAKNLEIDVWYSADEEWLALESSTESDRRLRYELE